MAGSKHSSLKCSSVSQIPSLLFQTLNKKEHNNFFDKFIEMFLKPCLLLDSATLDRQARAVTTLDELESNSKLQTLTTVTIDRALGPML
jgi:hypothetical protein